ncbi:MAG: ATP-binding protein [Spirochaetota bacterium]
MPRSLYRLLAIVSRARRTVLAAVQTPIYIIPFLALAVFSWWVTSLIYEPHITSIPWNNQFVIFFTVLAPLTCILIAVIAIVQLIVRYVRGEAGSAMRIQFTLILVVAILTPTILLTIFSLSLIRFNSSLWLSTNVEESLSASLDAVHSEVAPRAEDLANFLSTRQSDIFAADDAASLERLRAGRAVSLGKAANTMIASDRDGIAQSILRAYRYSPAERDFSLTHTYRGKSHLVAGIRSGTALIIAAEEMPRSLAERKNGIASSLRYYKLLRSSRDDFEFILTMMFIFSAIISAMAAILLAFLLSRSITAPLSSLADATRRIAHDELSYRIKPQGNREMRDLMERFNIMVRDLKRNRDLLAAHERMVAWRDVALRLAHEIKNPLTPINLNAELIAKEAKTLPKKERTALTRASAHILDQSATILSLVRDFSQFSFTTELSAERRSISAVVRQAFGSFSAVPRSITMEIALVARDLRIRMDSKKLAIALVNLIKNAIESLAEDGGRIRVASHHDDAEHTFCITITDTGHGIPEELRERIFEPYFTTKKKGSGLGLSVVETIIRDHGGIVEITDSGTKGTTFTVSFPLPEHER